MLAQVLRSRGIRIGAAVAIAGMACGGLAAVAGSARAGAASACPTVSAAGTVTPAPKPGVDWDGCDLSHANLSDANLINAKLAGARLEFTNLAGAELAGASLGDVESSNIAGEPASLPKNWHLAAGYLLGPGAFPAQEAELFNVNLAHYDLAGANLELADLTGTDLEGANLAGADLTEAQLENANLSGANFTAADLDRAQLESDLSGADLTNADMDGALLNGADIADATLTGARLAGVSSGGVTSSATTVLPPHWTMVGGFLAGPGADLAGNLSGLNLAGADLDGATVANANVSGTKLAQADLTGVYSENLDGLPASLPTNWFLVDGYLMGPSADLNHAELANLTLTGADLADANLSGANLSDSDLARSDLAHASLADATMTGADLTSADLNGADLSSADLSGATTTGATAVGATWWQTVCPDGSSSAKHVTGCLTPLDATPPRVTVTGVANGHTYVLGAVPRAFCQTTDNGKVATYATLAVTTTGTHLVGRFTDTCTGAVDQAGNKQAAPVRVSYAVIYGMFGYLAPARGSTIARSSKVVTVRFRLSDAGRTPLKATLAAALAAEHRVRATLRGPGITAVTANCPWNAAHQYLTCAVKIPGGVKTGAKFRYTITAYENLVGDFVKVPGVWRTTDPETVHFR